MLNIALRNTLPIILCALNAMADLTVKPRNVDTVVGKPVYFQCSTNTKDEIHWFHYPKGSTTRESVTESKFHNRFRVENTATGSYNLVITAVIEDDAGTYECAENKPHGAGSKAELTITDEIRPFKVALIAVGVLFGFSVIVNIGLSLCLCYSD